MRVKPAPLNASFMLTAMLGFLISVVYVRKIDMTWAFAFAVIFLIMIIAALISMVQAPARGQLMPTLEREFKEPENIKKLTTKLRKKAKTKKQAKKPKKKR